MRPAIVAEAELAPAIAIHRICSSAQGAGGSLSDVINTAGNIAFAVGDEGTDPIGKS